MMFFSCNLLGAALLNATSLSVALLSAAPFSVALLSAALLNYVSLSNQECRVRPQIVNVNS